MCDMLNDSYCFQHVSCSTHTTSYVRVMTIFVPKRMGRSTKYLLDSSVPYREAVLFLGCTLNAIENIFRKPFSE